MITLIKKVNGEEIEINFSDVNQVSALLESDDRFSLKPLEDEELKDEKMEGSHIPETPDLPDSPDDEEDFSDVNQDAENNE